ncbi:hypothetical protein GF373_07305 [bacterium]|nr:hypothetical protein [bacterium]
MPRYGKYDPTKAENTSSLFSFQEIPLTSSKLNCWNGNINAAFELLHAICSDVFSGSVSGVIHTGNASALLIQSSDPAGLTVRVAPGWAIAEQTFAGSKEPLSLPIGGMIVLPLNLPRIDLVYLRNDGEFAIVEGAESADPQPPELPDEAIALAELYLRVGMDRILNADDGEQGYITDRREMVWIGNAHVHANDRIPAEIPDGVRTEFSTQYKFRTGSLNVFVNGVLQEAGIDYEEQAGRCGYTFTYTPLSNYRIQHRYVMESEIAE